MIILSSPGIEVYITFPHQFLVTHQQKLLPDWNLPVASLILLLQQSTISLHECNEATRLEKQRCRERFIEWGTNQVATLGKQGYRGELFDPRTGYPWFGQPGSLSFDDNAVVSTLLHFPLQYYQNCSLLRHPLWKNNLYPATIVTSAPPEIAGLWSKKQLINWY